MAKIKQAWRIILTSEQLAYCLDSKCIVEIFYEEHIDYVGEILGFSEYRIEVEGGSYLRSNCKVRMEVSFAKTTSLDLTYE
ncbi:hypothetical protein [Paenibacillus glacialis]|uniref:Uncharacterized protein n=1 Tax=Paenibacillus glacialis TaxID=494026 RepID=A0A168FTB0_9BACL|nr:hypothetical protein [Paenibacillus glacialis]OAB36522.1 hypothetical protein PGLA_20915 [Paenibacillus glacialis]